MRLLIALLLCSSFLQAQEGPVRYYRELQRNAALRIEGLHQITEQEAQYGKAFRLSYDLQGQLHSIRYQCAGKPCWVNDALLYQAEPFVEVAVRYGSKNIQYHFLGENWEKQYQEILHLEADGRSRRIEWKNPKEQPNQRLAYPALAELEVGAEGAVKEARLSLSVPKTDTLVPFYTDRFEFDKIGRLQAKHRLIYDYLIRVEDYDYEKTLQPANGYKKTTHSRYYQVRQHELFDSLAKINRDITQSLIQFLPLGKLSREPAILTRNTIELFDASQRRMARQVSSPAIRNYRETWRYRPDGQLLEYQCKSGEDWFALHGYARRALEYTDDGLLKKEVFTDSGEELPELQYRPHWDDYEWGDEDELNFYARQFTYDEKGQISTENRLLSDGSSQQIIYSGRSSFFWERPLPKEIFYYDTDETLVWQKSLNYVSHQDSIWHPVWRKRVAVRYNHLKGYRFQNEAAYPIPGPRAILAVERFYSENGRHLLMEWTQWPFGYYQTLYRYPILEAKYGKAYVEKLEQQLDALVNEKSPEPVKELKTIEYDYPQRYPERWRKDEAGNWEYLNPYVR